MDFFALTGFQHPNFTSSQFIGRPGPTRPPPIIAQQQQAAAMIMPNNDNAYLQQPTAFSQPQQGPDDSSSSSAPTTTNQEDKDFQQRMELPTESQLRTAFNVLNKTFTLASILPKDLKAPLSDLTPAQRKELDGVNIALEHNVVKLFSIDSMPDIQEALTTLILQKDRYLVSAKIEKDKNDRMKLLLKKHTPDILHFYPHLIELIQALLAYHVLYSKTTVFQPNHPASFVFTAWMQILSYLISIHKVIAYGAQSGLVNLGTYPLQIDEVSKQNERSIAGIQLEIQKQERLIAEKKKIIQDQQEQVNSIQQQHQGLLQDIAYLHSTYHNLHDHLEALTDPQKIAEKNVEQIDRATA